MAGGLLLTGTVAASCCNPGSVLKDRPVLCAGRYSGNSEVASRWYPKGSNRVSHEQEVKVQTWCRQNEVQSTHASASHGFFFLHSMAAQA